MNNIKLVLIGLSLLFVVLFLLGAISIEVLIGYSIGLLVLSVVVTLGASGLNLFENPKGAKSILIGIGGLVLFYLIGLGIASESVDPQSQLAIEGSKQAEAGIYTLYFVIITAVVTLVYSSVKRVTN